MRYEVSAVVPGRPEDVFAWWTDYGAVGSRERIGHGVGWSDRTIESREGDRVVMRESILGVTVMRHAVDLHRDRLALKETADAFTAWWSFEAVPGGGTRIRRQVEVHGRGAKLAPRGLTVWSAQKDLDHHARDWTRTRVGSDA